MPTLVKLFGRPASEQAEFGGRAERVAEIGVRTAMGQYVFLTALALVSALALALVYGLGGYMALRGRLEPGTVVTLALLLTQLYAPLTALASARGRRDDGDRELRACLRGARSCSPDP